MMGRNLTQHQLILHIGQLPGTMNALRSSLGKVDKCHGPHVLMIDLEVAVKAQKRKMYLLSTPKISK
jgi:hypothetical protein